MLTEPNRRYSVSVMSTRFWLSISFADIVWTLPGYLSIGVPSAGTGVEPMTTTGGSCSMLGAPGGAAGAGAAGDSARAGAAASSAISMATAPRPFRLDAQKRLWRVRPAGIGPTGWDIAQTPATCAAGRLAVRTVTAAMLVRGLWNCQEPDGHQSDGHLDTASQARSAQGCAIPRTRAPSSAARFHAATAKGSESGRWQPRAASAAEPAPATRVSRRSAANRDVGVQPSGCAGGRPAHPAG